jgi:hypothetical protein
MKHPTPDALALYARGDLDLWAMARAGAHVLRCRQCAGEVQAVRQALAALKADALEMPAGLDWDEMAAEMRANIRLGLAAGAIVAESPFGGRDSRDEWPWQLGVVMASMAVVAVVSWMLPNPEYNRPYQAASAPVFLEAQAEGLALQDHGSALTLLNPSKTAVITTVNWDGGARASYVDSETGQVTIHHVSAQ